MLEKLGATGKKYDRTAMGKYGGSTIVDVYRVLKAFAVMCQARGHAIKKLLCAGLRGKGDEFSDVVEAIDAAIESAAMLLDENEKTLQPSKVQRLMILRTANRLAGLAWESGNAEESTRRRDAYEELLKMAAELQHAGEPRVTKDGPPERQNR